ncbi:hypothetical protein [Pseudomonas sp. BIC9C]|uniref:hypothetical protein n=1 Tax=Pseudomonas sp. BIC9C TaxID=3078458 RepID=UPI002AD41489|nr:hypothetical protein [Pseudomonas sp. BIC9C]
MSVDSPITPGAQYALNHDIHEVISVEPDYIAIRSISNKRYLFMPHDTFQALQAKGDLILHQHAPINKSLVPLLTNLTTPQSQSVRRKVHYIHGLAKKFHGTLPYLDTIAESKVLAASYGEPTPPCYTSLYTWFRQYKESNFNPLALIKKPSTRPRGKQLCSMTHAIIRDYIYTVYLKRPHPNIKTLYIFIQSHIEIENRTRLTHSTTPIDMPSLSTVHRAINSTNRYLLDLRHHGHKFAADAHKFGIKHEVSNTLLAVVQGDSHLMDLELIDENGCNLGRPWLYLLIELSTRCIIGWELSFIPPCAEKVLRAFRMALEISTDNQPGGRMEELVLDNGLETANHTIQNVAELLGFKITYAPPGCPDVKAHVERFFATLNSGLIHSIPGTTYSNREIRAGYNSEKKACLTIDQLNHHFSQWIRNVYHEFYHTGINQSPRMAWESALVDQLPPERYSKDDLDALCRSLTYRRLAKGRVRHLNLSWTGPGVPELAHRLKPKQKALIYYDTSDLSTVWVAHPDRPAELFEAYATDPNYQNHLTLFEHKLVQERLIEQRLAFSDANARQALMDLHREIQLDSEENRVKVRYKKRNSSKRSKKKAVRREHVKKTRSLLIPPTLSDIEISAAEATLTDRLVSPEAFPVIHLKGKSS